MTEFQLNHFTERGGKLLAKTKKIFSDYSDLELEKIDLPETMQANNGSIKLVFVRQYSSGKSSIIKMLTGIDMEIGGGIKTQEAHIYPWNELEIVDTPGIHTELRPDHDEKTYYEIDHAALLIFVVTNEGFDDCIGNHFRKLAIEQERAKNMVLIVNKMDRAPLGNIPEQQKIIANDLMKVTEPYKPEDLYVSFIDTESYFSAQDEDDEEARTIYMEQSGYDAFVSNLNDFVKSRGLLSKVQTPLETLKRAITNVIGDSDALCNDDDIDALEEVFRRKQLTLSDGKRQIHTEIEEIANTYAQKISATGAKLAGEVTEGVSEEDAKQKIEAAQHQTEIYAGNCEAAVAKRMEEICKNIGNEISLIDHSKFASDIGKNLSRKLNLSAFNGAGSTPSSDMNAFASITKNIKLESMRTMTAKSASKVVTGDLIAGAGKTNVAGLVKDAGHFFGYKFAPWGAVNFVKSFANVLGYIGIAYSIYQAYNEVFGSKKQEMKNNIINAQNEIKNNFDEVAEKMRTELIHAAESKMDSVMATDIKEADEQLANFQRKKDRLKSLNKELQQVLDEVKSLMKEVQQTATA